MDWVCSMHDGNENVTQNLLVSKAKEGDRLEYKRRDFRRILLRT